MFDCMIIPGVEKVEDTVENLVERSLADTASFGFAELTFAVVRNLFFGSKSRSFVQFMLKSLPQVKKSRSSKKEEMPVYMKHNEPQNQRRLATVRPESLIHNIGTSHSHDSMGPAVSPTITHLSHFDLNV